MKLIKLMIARVLMLASLILMIFNPTFILNIGGSFIKLHGSSLGVVICVVSLVFYVSFLLGVENEK